MTIERLESLLDASYEAARNSDFNLLAELVPALESALEVYVPRGGLEELTRLQSKSDRNSLCLSATARGIRSAIRRLEEVKRAVSGLAAYDDKGQRLTLSVAADSSRRL